MYPGLGETPVQPAAPPPDYSQEYAEEVFNVAQPLGVTTLDIPFQIQNEGDFIVVGLKGNSTGTYQLRIRKPNGKYMQSAPVNNVNLIGTAAVPTPLVPPLEIASGGRIGFDIVETSGALNNIQIVLVGIRRLRTR